MTVLPVLPRPEMSRQSVHGIEMGTRHTVRSQEAKSLGATGCRSNLLVCRALDSLVVHDPWLCVVT